MLTPGAEVDEEGSSWAAAATAASVPVAGRLGLPSLRKRQGTGTLGAPLAIPFPLFPVTGLYLQWHSLLGRGHSTLTSQILGCLQMPPILGGEGYTSTTSKTPLGTGAPLAPPKLRY